MKHGNANAIINISVGPFNGSVRMDHVRDLSPNGVGVMVRNARYGTFCGTIAIGEDIVTEIIKLREATP